METAAITFNGSAWTVTCAAGSAGAPCAPPSYRLLAGSASATNLTDGVGSAARFGSVVRPIDDNPFTLPNSITTDGAGNYFLCDSNVGAIRKITSAGVVTTLFTGNVTNPACFDATTVSAQLGLCMPMACAYSAGKLYIADLTQNSIWMLTLQTLALTLFAGTPGSPPGYQDGAAATALFKFCVGGGACDPMNRITSNGLAVASNGDIYVADIGNCVIRKVSGGSVSTVAGTNGVCGYVNGAATATAQFNFPAGLAFDSVDATNTALYIIDGLNQAPQVRMLSNGVVSTVVPSGSTFANVLVPAFTDRLTGIAVQNDQITVSFVLNLNTQPFLINQAAVYRFGPGPSVTQRITAVTVVDFFGLAPVTNNMNAGVMSSCHIFTASANAALLPPYSTGGSTDLNANSLLSAFLLLPNGTLVGSLLFSYISNATFSTAYSAQIIQADYAA